MSFLFHTSGSAGALGGDPQSDPALTNMECRVLTDRPSPFQRERLAQPIEE